MPRTVGRGPTPSRAGPDAPGRIAPPGPLVTRAEVTEGRERQASPVRHQPEPTHTHTSGPTTNTPDPNSVDTEARYRTQE